MRLLKKCVFSSIILCELLACFFVSANASAIGFGVYHDDAFGVTPFWHTGIMNVDSPDNTYIYGTITKAIVHLSSASNMENMTPVSVTYTSYNDFLNSKSFMGYYTAISRPSLYQRNQIIATARLLLGNSYYYKAFQQLEYSGEVTFYSPTNVVTPSAITGFRCDGVLEYAYEYNHVKLFGEDSDSESTWNISYNCLSSRNRHSGVEIFSPIIQANLHMRSMMGDVDADGVITAADGRLISRYAVGLETPNQYQAYVSNVTGSTNSISSEDARLVLRAAVGIEGDETLIGTKDGYRFPNDPLS